MLIRRREEAFCNNISFVFDLFSNISCHAFWRRGCVALITHTYSIFFYVMLSNENMAMKQASKQIYVAYFQWENPNKKQADIMWLPGMCVGWASSSSLNKQSMKPMWQWKDMLCGLPTDVHRHAFLAWPGVTGLTDRWRQGQDNDI